MKRYKGLNYLKQNYPTFRFAMAFSKDRARYGTGDENNKDEKSDRKWNTNFPMVSFHRENGNFRNVLVNGKRTHL